MWKAAVLHNAQHQTHFKNVWPLFSNDMMETDVTVNIITVTVSSIRTLQEMATLHLMKLCVRCFLN